jgi:hypothetical protein
MPGGRSLSFTCWQFAALGHQLCWGHLLWDIEAMIERGGRSQATAALQRPRLSDSRVRSGVVRQDCPFLAAHACYNRTAHPLYCTARLYELA